MQLLFNKNYRKRYFAFFLVLFGIAGVLLGSMGVISMSLALLMIFGILETPPESSPLEVFIMGTIITVIGVILFLVSYQFGITKVINYYRKRKEETSVQS